LAQELSEAVMENDRMPNPPGESQASAMSPRASTSCTTDTAILAMDATSKRKGKRKGKGKGKKKQKSDFCELDKDLDNICSMCDLEYDDNEIDEEWIECSHCCRWMHSKCSGLTKDEVVNIGDAILTCPKC
jgi:hypothetical protein